MPVTILHGDVMQVQPPGLFHALLCDPPYHLYSPADGRTAGKPDGTRKDPFQRVKGDGFMGQKWDGGDIAFRPETWARLATILHPGAFGFAFASSRGWHRLACAIEDAGLIIHPTIWLWVGSQGMPKSTRIDTQVDEAGQVTATNLARTWAGHRYGQQAIKPAVEPVICFQKPYEGRPVDCITKTGAGAFNIDGGRLGTDDELKGGAYSASGRVGAMPGDARTGAALGMFAPGARPARPFVQPTGRWPQNFALVHHPECKCVDEGTYECHPDCPVGKLDRQAGERTSGLMAAGQQRNATRDGGGYNGDMPNEATASDTYGDSGGASRFFFNADWQAEIDERLLLADPVNYCPKAPPAERDEGLAGQLPCPRCGGYWSESHILHGDDVLPLSAAGSDGVPALPEIERGEAEYKAARKSGKSMSPPEWQLGNCRRNVHPTIKPISLCRWLATLLLPPGAYAPRRILIPFAGAASECIAAMLAGWEDVVGIEAEDQYIPIARARVRFHAGLRSRAVCGALQTSLFEAKGEDELF